MIRLTHPLAHGASVEPADLWVFPEGLIGLPDLKRFALLELPGSEPFQLLCAADDSAFGLIVVDPRALVPEYVLELTPADLAPLETADPAAVQLVVPVVLPADGRALSLNLRGPILLAGNRGVQRVSPDENHSVRHVVGAPDANPAQCSS